MLKVFLAEDESIVREGLRDSIPWEECGYVFAGDAMDGETALPLILECRPDLLITDIRMPFMDGLELIRAVRAQLPETKVLILSGFDDFEYAQRAIELQVDRYLLKPIMKADMVKVLGELRQKIEEENEKKNYLQKYLAERESYDAYTRVSFFKDLIAGRQGSDTLPQRAEELGLAAAESPCAAVLVMLQPGTDYSEQAAAVQERLLQRLEERENSTVFRSGALNHCVLLQGRAEELTERTEECLRLMQELCAPYEGKLTWYAAAGRPVNGLDRLRESVDGAARLLSYRHFMGGRHIIRGADVDGLGSSAGGAEAMGADPMVIRSFIKTGLATETDAFLQEFLDKLGGSLGSVLFRNYLIVSVRINAAAVLQEMGIDREAYIDALPQARADMREEELQPYMAAILRAALAARDGAAQNRSGDVVNCAAEYIGAHFTEEDISLNTVARAINVSANYLSAAFSQKTGMPFTEYITEKRMELAKALLRQTAKRSGEIAAEVGYRDPRYFNFVFKKTQGCSPREYRTGETDK